MSFNTPIKPLALAIAAASTQAYGICTLDFNVDTNAEFNDALSSIASCGTIDKSFTVTIEDTVAETLYIESDLAISDEDNHLSIVGPSSAEATIAFTDDEASVTNLSISSGGQLNISNVTLDGQSDSENTRASTGLSIRSSELHLNNVVMQNFYGSNKGAIDAADSTISFTDSAFESNHAATTSGSGGVMYAEDSSEITITDSTFNNNSTAGNGGVINVYEASSAEISGSTFSNNTSAKSGGAINLGSDTSATISDSVFTGNNATTNNGGAIRADVDGRLTISDSVFSSNEVSGNSGNGGAIYVNETGITINNSTFSENHTLAGQAGRGGAIYLLNEGDSSITSTIDQSSFSDNGAYYGGALAVGSNGGSGAVNQLSITDTEFSGNSASNTETGYGGAISIVLGDSDAYSTDIQRSLFNGNSALQQAGAIYYTGQSNDNLIISNSTISNNQATTNGGITLSGNHGSTTKIEHSTIINNSQDSSSGGSAIHGNGLSAATGLVISHTIVANNTGGDSQVCNYNEASNNFIFENSFVSSDHTVAGSCLLNDKDDNSQVGTSDSPLDPLLNDLESNGGLTQSFYPTSNSPVVDAGDANIANPPDTDQRGNDRIMRAKIDIGAVEYGNLAPTLTNLEFEDPGLTEGDSINIDTAEFFSDAEGDSLTFSATGLPQGTSISTDGIISGVLDEDGDYTILIEAEDIYGASVVKTINISVEYLNLAPTVNDFEFEDPELKSGDEINIDTSEFFSDPEGDALSYTATGLPEGASISENGLISGVLNEPGDFNVTIKATDTSGEYIETSISVSIEEPTDESDDDFLGAINAYWFSLLALLGLARVKRNKD